MIRVDEQFLLHYFLLVFLFYLTAEQFPVHTWLQPSLALLNVGEQVHILIVKILIGRLRLPKGEQILIVNTLIQMVNRRWGPLILL